jgi:dihydrofolate reductase
VRKIVASLFISLDGVVEAPDQWHFSYFNDEMGELIGQQMAAADALLLGRQTYEAFASFWPNQSSDEPPADYLNNVRKYVVSNTLKTADWNNSTIISGNIAEQITSLKQQPGANITMSGSGALVQSLLYDGLLDELVLLVHPIVVGKGKRLFDGIAGQVPLKLVESRPFSTGVIVLTYVPTEAPEYRRPHG